jgi:hypothetical protein
MKTIKIKLISLLAIWPLLLFTEDVLAVSARIITLPIPGGQAIDPNTGHFSLSVESGFISSKGGFQSLFYSTKSATFVVRSSINFKSGVPLQLVITHTIDDPNSNMDRPLGFSGLIYPDIPGDIISIDTTVNISISGDQIVGQTLMALEKNKTTLPSQIFSSPWLGYTQTVSTLIDVFFGTNSKSTPISGHTIISSPTQESYIVLLASDHDGDSDLNNLDSSDLIYDSKSNILKRNNHAIEKWTYVVFKLSGKSPSNIITTSLGSDAPWATVINTQLTTLPFGQINDEKQLQTVANNTLESLKNLQGFLINEHSFSNYDRAIGLHYLVTKKIQDISIFCKRKKFEDCPVDELSQYQRNLENIFGIPQDSLDLAFKAIDLQNKFARTTLTLPDGSTVIFTASIPDEELYDFKRAKTVLSFDVVKTYLERHPTLKQPNADKETYSAIAYDVKENPQSYKADDVKIFTKF